MTTPPIMRSDSGGGYAQVSDDMFQSWTIDPVPFPGRHTADASLWSGIATMLATLDFNAIKDEKGNDVRFEAEFASGITQ